MKLELDFRGAVFVIVSIGVLVTISVSLIEMTAALQSIAQTCGK